LGNFNASILVEEYRAGVKIGEIRRDMQFIVVPTGGNTLPEFTNIGNLPTDSNGHPYLSILAGQGYNLSLLASDPDTSDVVSLEAFGEPFMFNINGAAFSTAPTGNGNEVQGDFSWYPDNTMAREKPYLVVFRARDNEFTFDEAVFMEVVENTTGIEAPRDLNIGKAYPNPASTSLYIPVTLDKASELNFAIYSFTGAKVKLLGTHHYGAGNHIIQTDPGLAPGAYFLSIEQDGKMVHAEKIMIVR
jgi:hypothetical protein